MKNMSKKTYEITIIGAGAVGLYLANLLLHKKNILVLESGPRNHFIENDFRDKFKVKGIYKNGKRARGIGGTTNLWGGQMLPFMRSDFSQNNGWPLSWEEIKPHYESVSNKFLYESAEYESRDFIKKRSGFKIIDIQNPNFFIHVSKWLKDPKFKNIFFSKLKNIIKLETNCTVKNIEKYENKYIINYTKNKKNISIKSKKIILAAGTLETLKILFNSKTKNNLPISDKLGEGFMDHIEIKLCEIFPKNRVQFLRLFNTRILKNKIRYSIRLSAKEFFIKAQPFLNISAGFVIKTPTNIFKKIINNIFAFLSSYISGSIIKPFGIIELTIYLEQKPIQNRKITIDKKGRLNIQYKPYMEETLSAINFGEVILNSLYEKKLIKKSEIPKKNKVYDLMEDMNHPMGGAPMHNQSDKSVVNKNLELIKCPNIFLCSAAVFPSGSHSNPTMTVLALADRLAKHLLE